MGIHGLTTFMNRTYIDQVIENIELKNCFLLVDANSFLHSFYSANNLQPFYTGNYGRLAHKLNEMFIIFEKCKIKPVFLLDGGQDADEKKLKTKLNRTKERLKNSCLNILNDKINIERFMASGYYPVLNGLLPINAFKVFIKVLQTHQFIYYQCTFEADYDLAYLANILKCPVLSGDSDFLVYDLKCGFIKMEHFELNVNKLKNEINDRMAYEKEIKPDVDWYLFTKIYKLEKFLNVFNAKKKNGESNLTKEMLPIFAVLMGNDYVESEIFSSFTKSISSSNNNQKHKNQLRSKQKRILHPNKILTWLAKHQNSSTCLESILHFVKSESREFIRILIKESLNEYLCLKPSKLNAFLFDQLKIPDHPSQYSEKILTYCGNTINFHFLSKFNSAEIGRFSLDVLIHRRLIFNSQIELINWPSSYFTSSHIRKVFYSILINKFEKEIQSDQSVVIIEYLRFKNDIKIYKIELTDYSKYTDIRLLDQEFILKHCLAINDKKYRRFQEAKKFNESIKNWFAVLNFWMQYSSSSISDEKELFRLKKQTNCKRAFIVSLIKCSIVDVCYNKFADISKIKLSHASTDLKITDMPQNHNLLNDTKYTVSDEFIYNLNEFILADTANNEYIKTIQSKLNSFCPSFTINHSQVKRTGAHRLASLFNLKLIHCLSEFQAIYFSLNYLLEGLGAFSDNKMSKKNFILPCLDEFYNGAFLHSFFCELEGRADPDLYIEEILGRKSLLRHIYVRLIACFDEIFVGDDTDNLEVDFDNLKF